MFLCLYSAAKIEGGSGEDEDEEDGDGGFGVSKKDPSLRRSELLSKSGLAKVRNCFKLSSRYLGGKKRASENLLADCRGTSVILSLSFTRSCYTVPSVCYCLHPTDYSIKDPAL